MRDFEISSITVSEINGEELVEVCEKLLSKKRPVHICTVNAEIAESCYRDEVYRSAVKMTDIRTIDGIGISLAIFRQYRYFPARLSGLPITMKLIEWAKKNNREVLIIGSTNESREKAEKKIEEMGITVKKGISPYVDEKGNSDSFIDNLPKHGVVMVALGHPKQEYWIRKQILLNAPPNIFIGVGGAIDYISGAAKYPPAIIRKVGLEWLYRLLKEPQKRLKRQKNSLPQFVIREIIKGG